jgi:hypothetical protein
MAEIKNIDGNERLLIKIPRFFSMHVDDILNEVE